MRNFLKKRWHGIPVGIVSGVLALALVAGGAFAAYSFLEADIEVEVEEAMVIGIWDTWDNLEPYGSVDDVEITLGGTLEVPVINITTIEGYAGEGFVAGEWIVIPVNLRNAGDGTLNLEASASGGGGYLVLECSYEENLGPVSSWGPENQPLCREYQAVDEFDPLHGWADTIGPNGGKSGSAVVGAKVLFVRVSAPGDVIPGTYTFHVTLNRS